MPQSTPRPIGSALAKYNRWSTTVLYTAVIVIMLMLAVIARQTLYGIIAILLVMFPNMHLACRFQTRNKTPRRSHSNQSSPHRGVVESPQREVREGEGIAQRPSDPEIDAVATTPTRPDAAATTPTRPDAVAATPMKIINLPCRPAALRVLMVIALVHWVLTVIGGILVATIPSMKDSYDAHPSYFALVGI
jgi:hypothetical protein